MITRQMALRQGRIAFAKPCTISWRRALATAIEEHTSSLPQAGPSELDLSPGNISPQEALAKTAAPRFDPKYGTFKADYEELQEFRRKTRKLGSNLTPYYKPREQITRPPAPSDVSLEGLMAAQAHFGHATGLWHPGNARYIYGIRAGIHIISLDATASHLRRAAKIVRATTSEAGIVLFVGTREGQMQSIVRAAELSGGYHLFDRWIPGSITNANHILARCRKTMVDPYDRPVYDGKVPEMIEKRALKPDLVVVLNPLENLVLLSECKQHHIATIGIIDTDCDPTLVTYPIPANDDSRRCTNYIAGVLGRAGEEGRLRRYEFEDFKHANKVKMKPAEAKAEIKLEQERAAEEMRQKQAERAERAPKEDALATGRGGPTFPVFAPQDYPLNADQQFEEDAVNADAELWTLSDEQNGGDFVTDRAASLLVAQHIAEAESEEKIKQSSTAAHPDAESPIPESQDVQQQQQQQTAAHEAESAAGGASAPESQDGRPEDTTAEQIEELSEIQKAERDAPSLITTKTAHQLAQDQRADPMLARLVAVKRRALGERLSAADKEVLADVEQEEELVRADVEEGRAQMLNVLEVQEQRYDVAAKEAAAAATKVEVKNANTRGIEAAVERRRSSTAHHEGPAQIGPVKKSRKGLPDRG